jgi:phenylalanyl-tRNA synthetase alpha chain
MTPGASGQDLIAEHLERFQREASEVADRAQWDELRLRWVGRKQGLLKELLGRLRDLPPEQRRDFGQGVNKLKVMVEERLASIDAELEAGERARRVSAAAVDVTLPGRDPGIGSVHPTNLIVREIVDIFTALGYSVAEGPEVESDYYNFEALNFPVGHPARDEQDTFFVEDGRVLRTHTSPVQIRTLKNRRPPIRVICPGRTYRVDNDLRHSPMFHQVECLAVAEGLTFGHLKGTLEAFIHRLFDEGTGVKLRPSYFPFTEPSAEVDITCPFCHGEGCATCSGTGWMEILGAGMVDPRVLAEQGIDPDVYSGYAFGLGIDRVAMIKYGIPNIRLLFDNDERLLRQVKS